MKLGALALATLFGACDDRRPQQDPEDAGTPSCSLEGIASDEQEAQAEVEALLTCEGGPAEWEVTCSPPVKQWDFPGHPTPAGDDVVGHEVVSCQATFADRAPRSFDFRVGELRLQPVERGLGRPRCIAEGTPSAERYEQCRSPATDDPAEPAYPEVTTLEAAYDYVQDLLICAGCLEAEYQIDCWGPVEYLLQGTDVEGWHMFACRLSDLVRPSQLMMLIPFDTF